MSILGLDGEWVKISFNNSSLLSSDIESLKLSVLQSSGAAGAAGAAQHSATAAAAALRPDANNGWAPATAWQPSGPNAWVW